MVNSSFPRHGDGIGDLLLSSSSCGEEVGDPSPFVPYVGVGELGVADTTRLGAQSTKKICSAFLAGALPGEKSHRDCECTSSLAPSRIGDFGVLFCR